VRVTGPTLLAALLGLLPVSVNAQAMCPEDYADANRAPVVQRVRPAIPSTYPRKATQALHKIQPKPSAT
jgi:hypothetical protein